MLTEQLFFFCARIFLFGSQVIDGDKDLRETWAALPGPTRCSPKKRLFIHVERQKLATFALDFYGAAENPGFFPSYRDADVAVLYRVKSSKITNVWVAKDTEGIGCRDGMAFADVQSSKFFVGDVLEVLFDSFGPKYIEEMKVHYNDYSSIPLVG